MEHKQDNAFILESSEGETIFMVGVTEEDSDDTMLFMTKGKRRRKKHFVATLPREVLEYMRESIDVILAYHDSKGLD